jgi:nicotinamidase-related amidase
MSERNADDSARAKAASTAIRDVLLVVDVIDDFRHSDGEALLASFRARVSGMVAVLRTARDAGVTVIYANDNRGIWDGDAGRLVTEATERGFGADVVQQLEPCDEDRFLVKPRYSAFDLTPLPLLLRELGAQRLILIGATTEMCVAQTAIDARERGYKVTVLADACACVDPTAEQIALSYLRSVTGTFVRCASEWSPGSMLEDRNAAEART